MKTSHPWHLTWFGKMARFLGGIRLAVPVLAFTAIAIAWGTYLESTSDAKTARALVYGSWWFIALMGLVCVSLVFAVVTRYPWKRRHVGFITVHASLLALIAGGFWSLFGRVEGRLTLREGASSDFIETDTEQLQVLEHQGGQFLPVASAAFRPGATLTLAGLPVQVIERWGNTREEHYVADDGPEPFRAVEVSLDPAAAFGEWVGEESKSGGPAVLRGLTIRLLADGSDWEAPAESPPNPDVPAADPAELHDYAFTVGESRYPLAAEGREAFPGWTIVSIRRYQRALVNAEGLTENAGGPENPAVDVVISDASGSSERHTAFLKFPDMLVSRNLAGAARSGARLTAVPHSESPETLVIYGPAAAPRFAYVAPDGSARRLDAPGSFPATLRLGDRTLVVLRHLTRARSASRFLRAPDAREHRPALVLRVGDSTELTVAAWKDLVHLDSPAFPGRHLLLRYGPGQVQLPFAVRLDEFRKTDYPGTDMAMAYESDVAVSFPGRPDQPFRVYMNNPYSHGPWKVYQSGFVGDDISIFSVMRDPGLPLTYLASIGLCVGIVITFYSRRLSWGHPGIPIGFNSQEPLDASRPPSLPRPARARAAAEPAGAGV